MTFSSIEYDILTEIFRELFIMQHYTYSNLYQVIEANLAKSPNKTMIYEDDLKISSRELKIKIDAIAECLVVNGIGRRDKVALVVGNCWQFIAIMFAISKIGAIIVPINNFLKEEELTYIVNDSQAKLLFSSAKFANETKDLLSKCAIEKTIWIDGAPLVNEKNIDFDVFLKSNQSNPSREFYSSSLDDIAFIVYTSGTTGKPKGAMLSYRNILSNCEGAMEHLRVKEGEAKFLCYLPMFHAFTLTVTVIAPIFSNSGVIVIRSISNKKDFKNLLKQLLLKRCKYFTGVPEIYSAMSRAKLPWYFHWFHNVKGFVSGAAPLSDEVLARFTANFKRGKLLQGYGISECSPVVSCNTPWNNKDGSVGLPLPGYKVKIFDENMQEQAIGDIGEICVQGDCVMQGYYNRDAETKEAIVNGWFRTGDLGRIDKDGYIFIMDRKKDLIIHKGMNIYPREIEEILYTHEKINACAVIGAKDKEDNEIPIVYIELKEDQTATEAEMKDFVKPRLALFKQPRKVYFIEKLPRNATGKILKRELRDLHKESK